MMINEIIKFFSCYNSEIYIDYEILVDILTTYQSELQKVVKFLKGIEKDGYTNDYVNHWYFNYYFSYRSYGTKTEAFDLTAFLFFAVTEYTDFQEEIIDNIYD